MINHNDCLHTKDSKGRAACRAAGGPEGFARKVHADAIASGEALCSSCFWNAVDAATENYIDRRREEGATFETDTHGLVLLDIAELAEVYTEARGYLFDRNALSACTSHQDRI